VSGCSRLAPGHNGRGSAQISRRSQNFYCLNVKVPMLCSATVGVPPHLERPYMIGDLRLLELSLDQNYSSMASF